MGKTFSYGMILITISLIRSLNSWGSEPLPQLSSCWQIDTLPVEKVAPVQQQHPEQTVTETVVSPVVKEVPKSRKKMKPVPVNPKVKVPPAKIIRPKIIIRKINVNVL